MEKNIARDRQQDITYDQKVNSPISYNNSNFHPSDSIAYIHKAKINRL